MWKETYTETTSLGFLIIPLNHWAIWAQARSSQVLQICQKRHVYVKREQYQRPLPLVSHHTSEPPGNLGTGQVISGTTNMSKETYACEKRPIQKPLP